MSETRVYPENFTPRKGGLLWQAEQLLKEIKEMNAMNPLISAGVISARNNNDKLRIILAMVEHYQRAFHFLAPDHQGEAETCPHHDCKPGLETAKMIKGMMV